MNKNFIELCTTKYRKIKKTKRNIARPAASRRKPRARDYQTAIGLRKVNKQTICFVVWVMLLQGAYGFAAERKIPEYEIEELAQAVSQQKREMTESKSPVPKKSSSKLSSSVELLTGYETNVKLSRTRKGDLSEGVRYALSRYQIWPSKIRFTFNYNLSALEYNEITDVTSISNSLRFGLDKSFRKMFLIGSGVDVSSTYYPYDEEGHFIFPKGFLSFKHRISQTMNQELRFELGFKDYFNAKALANSLTTFRDKKRFDTRQLAEYSLGKTFNPALSGNLRLRFTDNDSNAHFQDYYDYESYDISPRLTYKFLKDFILNWNLSYTYKIHRGRIVSSKGSKQRDDIASSGLGLRYLVNDTNSVSVTYTYRQAESRDPVAKYTGSSVNCGWQYRF